MKGPWRFYSEALLDCCIPLERVKEEGVSLPQVACLARCNGAVAAVERPPPFDEKRRSDDEDSAGVATNAAADADATKNEEEGNGEEEEEESEATKALVAEAEASFRRAVTDSCRGGPESVVASYSRTLVNQTGDGHFSPIGAYDAESDSVLVLDVARFKYSPHWLPLRALVKAMRPPDKATGRPRGWLRVRAAQAPRSVLFTLEGAATEAAAVAAARYFGETTLPELLRGLPEGGGGDAAASLVSKAAAAAPLAAVAAFVGLRAPSAAAAAETAKAAAALAAGGAATEAKQQQPHACGSEVAPAASALDETACAIPDAAAALLAELESWPALRVVREALDRAHPDASSSPSSAFVSDADNKNKTNNSNNGCSARSSAAASVAGRTDVALAAAVAAREQRELEVSGLLPERLVLLLAAAGDGDAASGGSSDSAPARKLLTPPSGSVLAAEVSYLRAQWKELPALDAASAESARAAAG